MVSRRYPSYLYRDVLLDNKYLSNDREGTPITLTNNIDLNVEGDFLLNGYINRLDEEIYQALPVGLGDLGEAWWKSDKWAALATKMANEARKHGWCVVQFYDEDAPRRWEVFSVVQFVDYIKETVKIDDVEKLMAVGMKFEWGDYLGNSFREEVRFDDPMTHLIKYEEGNGMSVFAFPDLNQAIMTLAFEFRQAKGQMLFSAAKPSYQHFKYGMDANDDNIDDLDAKIKGIDATSAIGAPLSVLDSIDVVENKNLAIIEPALDKQLTYFAGLTRLPVAFYMGEKQSSGMSDMGEKTDMLKIRIKKEFIFNRFAPFIMNIFEEVYGIVLDELELPQDAALEEVEEDNGQEDKRPDSGKETQ